MSYISIVVTVSRPEHVDNVVEQLQELSVENDFTEVIIAVDNRDINALELRNKARQMGFRNVELLVTANKPPPKNDIPMRHKRIAELRNQTKELIGGSQFVFSFEDDTTLPYHIIGRLISLYSLCHQDRIGLVTGIQAARWGKPHIGVWKVDDLEHTTIRTSLPFRDEGWETIDAAGFFCFLTPTAMYKAATFRIEQPNGPDVQFGLDLRKLGYTNLVDWTAICGHLAEKETIYPYPNMAQVEYYLKGRRWSHRFI